MAALGRSLARAAREGAKAAALGLGRRIAHRAAEGRGPVARFSTIPGTKAVPLGSIGPIGPDRLPVYVDWNKFGAVTPVQDQGNCGGCWAFSCTALIEAANFFSTKKLLKLSEQHLIDANDLRNYGCDGGSIGEGLDYVVKNGGQLLEKDYPYVGVQCPAKRITAFGVTIDGYETFQGLNEIALKMLVASGPVAATVGVDESFLDYQYSGVGKVLDGHNYSLEEMRRLENQLSILIIGYGETIFGEKFWLVKSSHGGELMLIARENGKAGGAFGIANHLRVVHKNSANGLVTVKTDKDMGVSPRVQSCVKSHFSQLPFIEFLLSSLVSPHCVQSCVTALHP
ncbi:ervatamin-C-like [Miscanthus floridulus]|uniref:ervatamin-C-like n=1 Tax=Miscanthus floridulus TaxID=154761 RepID=UPI003459165F